MPVERSDKTGMAMLFERLCARAEARVQQPPKSERSLAATKGKIVLERENRQINW
jgi:hypothetical protein